MHLTLKGALYVFLWDKLGQLFLLQLAEFFLVFFLSHSLLNFFRVFFCCVSDWNSYLFFIPYLSYYFGGGGLISSIWCLVKLVNSNYQIVLLLDTARLFFFFLLFSTLSTLSQPRIVYINKAALLSVIRYDLPIIEQLISLRLQIPAIWNIFLYYVHIYWLGTTNHFGKGVSENLNFVGLSNIKGFFSRAFRRYFGSKARQNSFKPKPVNNVLLLYNIFNSIVEFAR